MNSKMITTFDEYNKATMETVIYPRAGKNLVYPALELASETGEFVGLVKKAERGDFDLMKDKDMHTKAVLELGDVLWGWFAACRELGVTPEYVATMNVNKLKARIAAGTLKGSGDSR